MMDRIASVARLIAPMDEYFEQYVLLLPEQRKAVAHGAAAAGAELITCGYHRCAFALGPTEVLKVAKGRQGCLANQRERDLWASAPTAWRRFLMPIHAASADGRWLVMRRSPRLPPEDWFAYVPTGEASPDYPLWPAVPEELIGATGDPENLHNWGMLRGRPVMIDYA